MSTRDFAAAFEAAVKYAAEKNVSKLEALFRSAVAGQRSGDYLPTAVLSDYLEENPQHLANADADEALQSMRSGEPLSIAAYQGKIHVGPRTGSGRFTPRVEPRDAGEYGSGVRTHDQGPSNEGSYDPSLTHSLTVTHEPDAARGSHVVQIAVPGGGSRHLSWPSTRGEESAYLGGFGVSSYGKPPSARLRELIESHHTSPENSWHPLLDQLATEYPEHFETAVNAHFAARSTNAR